MAKNIYIYIYIYEVLYMKYYIRFSPILCRVKRVGKCDALFCPDQRAVGSRAFSDSVREFSPDESADASAVV